MGQRSMKWGLLLVEMVVGHEMGRTLEQVTSTTADHRHSRPCKDRQETNLFKNKKNYVQTLLVIGNNLLLRGNAGRVPLH